MYQYVKKEIMGYDNKQSLPPKYVLKLKGLAEGKAMANKKVKAKANYGYDIVLYTFKAKKADILRAVGNKTFSDEFAKFRYICAIVENSINDIYKRVQNAKKSKEKTESLNVDVLANKAADYIRKSGKVNERLKDLW